MMKSRKIILRNCQRIVGNIDVRQETLDSLNASGIKINIDNSDKTVTFIFDEDEQIEVIMTWIIDYVDRNVQIIDNLNKLWNKLRKFVNSDKSQTRIDMLKFKNR